MLKDSFESHLSCTGRLEERKAERRHLDRNRGHRIRGQTASCPLFPGNIRTAIRWGGQSVSVSFPAVQIAVISGWIPGASSVAAGIAGRAFNGDVEQLGGDSNRKRQEDSALSRATSSRLHPVMERFRLRSVISPGIAPNIIAMPMGQGHETFTRFASGRGANPISILAPMVEAETGALAWAATRVRISKVQSASPN